MGLKRDPKQFKAKLFRDTIMAFVVACIFYDVGINNENGLEGKVDKT